MVWVGPAPRFRLPTGRNAGKDSDIAELACVWVELDYRRTQGGPFKANQKLLNFPLRPTAVVNVEHGRQVYFALNTPLSDSQLLDWESLMRGLRDSLSGSNPINPARLLLLPGGRYIGENGRRIVCRLDEKDSSWSRYEVSHLEEALREINDKGRVNSIRVGSGGELQQFSLASLRERGVAHDVIEAIITGRRPHSNSPCSGLSADNSRDVWIVTSLLNNGFKKEEIKSIYRIHPEGCGSVLSKGRNGEEYIEFTVRTAAALCRRQNSNGGEGVDAEDVSLPEMPSDYSQELDGSIWFKPSGQETIRRAARPVKVANSYIGIAQIRENVISGQISLVIAYKYLGRMCRAIITRSQMLDARQIVASLSGQGAPVTSNNARLVIAYLSSCEHELGRNIPRVRVTSRFGRGRGNGVFYLPGVTHDVEFAPAAEGDSSLYRAYSSRAGSLQGWLEAMRTLADDSLMIPQTAVLTSFIPPLQSRLQLPNFILDISGDSSTGKSTSLRLAASVYGRPTDPDSLVMQWMNTKVAVEHIVDTCSELPIYLDDAQHCPKELKRSMVYMIANGKGKARAVRTGGIETVPTWHTVALSTSEEPLHESSPHEGARGRILPLGNLSPPFPPGNNLLVKRLEKAVAANHGHAGEAYISHLNGWSGADWSKWLHRYTHIRDGLLRESTSNIVDRMSGYIAAIQVAAEIACPLLGLTFKPSVVGTWLMLQVTEAESSRNVLFLALRALADHYVRNVNHFAGDGRYTPEKKVALHGLSRNSQYIGFLRSTLDAVFKLRKWNTNTILNKMADAGVLLATENDRHTKKVGIEGIKHRMICVKWGALLPDDQPSDVH